MLNREPRRDQQSLLLMAPEWSLWPLIMLATAASLIGSQAVISGVFSVTTQAVSFGSAAAGTGRAFIRGACRTDLRADHELALDGGGHSRW